MKHLLSTTLLFLSVLFGQAANPPFSGFYGTNGITVYTNPATGIVRIDGSGITSPTGGVSAATATNIATFISSSAFIAATTNIVWVSAGGNNATAARNRLDLPARTMTKAVDLATYGDTVITMPTTYYDCSNLWRKSGVNFFLLPGTLLTFTNTATDLGWGIFDDRFSNMAVTSNVAGGGNFLWVGGLPTSDTGTPTFPNAAAIGYHVQTNARSRTVIDGRRVDYAGFSVSAGTPAASYCKAGTNTIRLTEGIFDIWFRSNYITFDAGLGGDVDFASSTAGIYWEAGEQHVYSPVTQGKAYALYPSDVGSGTAPNEWHFTGDLVEGKYYANGQSNLHWKTWVRFNTLINTNGLASNGAGVELLGGGRHYLMGIGKVLSGSSYGFAVGAGPQVWADIQKIEAKTQWVVLSGGRTDLKFSSCNDGGAVVDGFDISGGTNFISGLDATVTNTAGRIVRHAGGVATFKGITMTVSGNTNSPVNVRTNGLTLENCSLVTSVFAITSDVNATNSVNVKGSFGTKDTTNKVTVAVGPWTVDPSVQ